MVGFVKKNRQQTDQYVYQIARFFTLFCPLACANPPCMSATIL